MRVNGFFISSALATSIAIAGAYSSSTSAATDTQATLTDPQAVSHVAMKLRDSALQDPFAYDFLRELTTRFGARPAGSESATAAGRWGERILQEAGLKNVTQEKFLLKRWTAQNVKVQILQPGSQSLVSTLLGGSLISGPVEGTMAYFPTYTAFLASPPGESRDKIVVIGQELRRTADGSDYVAMVPERSKGPAEAKSRGALGFVIRSLATHSNRLASSGSTSWASHGTVPAFAISAADAEQLQRLGQLGPVRLKLDATTQQSDVSAGNVIAIIPGSDSMADPVVISAHLDSWEQGTGAIDDGFGLATVTAAARLIAQLPIAPRRTIRVVWFGAEEVSQPPPVNDFPAARAYAARHQSELEKYAMVGESDWGGGRITSLSLPAGAASRSVGDQAAPILKPLGIAIEVDPVKIAGPDIAVLQKTGVPAFRLNQDATGFFDTHHNANDIFDQVDNQALKQNVAGWVAWIWLLANSDGEFREVND